MAFHAVDISYVEALPSSPVLQKTATCINKHPSPESCWKDKSLHLIILRLSGSDFIEFFWPPAAWANARQELTGNLELL